MEDFLTGLEREVDPKKIPKPKPEINKQNEGHSNWVGNAANPIGYHVNLDELDKEFAKAQLKRNNSDTIRNKDELKSKKMILRELQDLKESLFY